jgi:outer membrane protein assembly factor BamB/orotate phosphoribosyltransferase
MIDPKAELKKMIEQEVFSHYVEDGERKWIFDFRAVSMTHAFMTLYAEIFFRLFGDRKQFQISGLESSAIPLVAALVSASKQHGAEVNGLFVRKSRKKHDLHKAIEGSPTKDPIILIDDILNTGKSIETQIAVLKKEGLSILAVFCLVRFRDISFYEFLTREGITIVTPFDLNDFAATLGLKNMLSEAPLQPLTFKHHWGFAIPPTQVNYADVVPKSAPLLFKDMVLFGTDAGVFYCIDKRTGTIIWTYAIRFGDRKKRIYSSPIVFRDTVYFGSYDGTFYALDVHTGKKKWSFMDADWIGSSPCISPSHEMVFVGLEFGLWKKRGGIASLNANTGKEIWRDLHPGLTHCSPFFSEKNNLVLCGSNDGTLRIYRAQTGELLKEHKMQAAIRASFSEDASGTRIAFGAFDSKCHIIDTTTLELIDSFETLEAIYSTPLWIGDDIVVGSLDKHVYAYDSARRDLRWKFRTRGRIFCNPTLIHGSIFIGSNDGALYKLSSETGKEIGHIQTAERIVNPPLFDSETGRTYLPLFVNEIRCLTIE